MGDNMQQGYSTTTTTTTRNETKLNTTIRFDPSYIRSLPGMLKVGVIVLNLIGFVCIVVSEHSYSSRANWFNFVAMGGFWITAVLLALYIFHFIEKFSFIPWLKVEMAYCALWSFFYLTAASAAAAFGYSEAFIAAAFFGFCAMVVYGVDAFLKLKCWKQGGIAQGERTSTTTSTSTVTSPAY